MLDTSTIAVIFAGLAFALNLGQRIFGGGWNLSKNLTATETRLHAAIASTKREIEETQHAATKDVGETISALKEHVRHVEFHVRDHYIRKDDFQIFMKSHDEMLRLSLESITARLNSIDKRLDGQKT